MRLTCEDYGPVWQRSGQVSNQTPPRGPLCVAGFECTKLSSENAWRAALPLPTWSVVV